MELSQVMHVLLVVLSCVLLPVVMCDEEQQGSQVGNVAVSQPQKRSVSDGTPLQEGDLYSPLYSDDDVMDKRSSLFRFGKRGSLFRFGKRSSLFRFGKRGFLMGKRGSLFRFGKRGSLFRFGKRGSLFRFGKRDGGIADDWEGAYPSPADLIYVPDQEMDRTLNAFNWDRETADE